MRKILVLLVIVMTFLCSCTKSNEAYDSTKKLFQMKGYNTVADITVVGNKASTNYKEKQYYYEPDKLRVETIEPDFLKGKIMVRNGDIWKVYHPSIKQTYSISKLKDDNELICMGIILKSVFSGEDTKTNTISLNGEKCVRIKSTIPGSNKYRHDAVLYVSEKSGIPFMMEILDEEGKAKVTIKYSEFSYDDSFKEALFKLE